MAILTNQNEFNFFLGSNSSRQGLGLVMICLRTELGL
uniref:Uncharacterized protein n=1 Tax=Rhizophora mucronata TaxID=61149 RepID=A0A2P2KYX8_RHIMU